MSRPLPAVLVLALIIIVAGCGDIAAGALGGAQGSQGQQRKVGNAAVARPTPRPTPTPAPTPPPLRLEDLLGSDGRLTVLILGSDSRAGVLGTRTDVIIAATINPRSGRVAMVSLPRDTINVPIAPGDAYSGRINGLYGELERQAGKPRRALKQLKQALAYAFGTEIDYYALVGFDGLTRLVNSIGGVDVTLDAPLIDPTMHLGRKGLKLKAGKRHLDGRTALAFSRSRHSDSDYARSGRQHQVLTAAADKVRRRGADRLGALVDVARKKIITDLPFEAAPLLLELMARANLDKVKSVVLEPGRYARTSPGYTITPRVLEIQRLFDRLFKPVGH
jgi:LCP family protein required for cell wall assembly